MPVTVDHPTSPPERKKERLELRVAPSAKALIQRAMAVSGLTAGDLAYERMVLTAADRDAFLDAILNPPEPADRLIAALRRHRDLMG
jgi:uncharacterized protein (DUF1778 family)